MSAATSRPAAELPAGHRVLRTTDLKNDPPVARAINAIVALGRCSATAAARPR